MDSTNKPCPRCGHDMYLNTVSIAFPRKTTIEFEYVCPRCRKRLVFEKLEVEHNGDKLLIRRVRQKFCSA